METAKTASADSLQEADRRKVKGELTGGFLDQLHGRVSKHAGVVSGSDEKGERPEHQTGGLLTAEMFPAGAIKWEGACNELERLHDAGQVPEHIYRAVLEDFPGGVRRSAKGGPGYGGENEPSHQRNEAIGKLTPELILRLLLVTGTSGRR
jgi:hypothetical protein